MQYISTRDESKLYSLEDMLLMGLAPDQGLFVPKTLPKAKPISANYDEIALQILNLFFKVDSVSDIYKQFPRERTPLKKLGNNYVLELFHGPSFAFKDVALQTLGYLFSQTNKKDIKVIVATSGDTGAAAIHGLKDHNIKVVVLYPKDRVSKVQHAQMTSVNHPCVKVVEVDGTFDDCQSFVKQVLHTQPGWCAVNSINFARIIAQMTYYVYACKQLELQGESIDQITFNVPTGNFGDVLAGYYAREIFGLKFKLHIATNENDVIVRLLQTGVYSKQAVTATHSPAMDITLPSNLERILYHAGGSSYVKQVYETLKQSGSVTMTDEVMQFLKSQFTASKTSDKETIETIRQVYKTYDYLPCPHTAVAMYHRPETHQVFLATAHPGKFPTAIHSAVQLELQAYTPKSLLDALGMPKQNKHIKSYEELLQLIKSFD